MITTAAHWLAHAGALWRQEPVTEVTLTTWPALCVNTGTASGWEDTTVSLLGYTGTVAPAGTRPAEVVRRLLALEWPGITFRLPEDAP